MELHVYRSCDSFNRTKITRKHKKNISFYKTKIKDVQTEANVLKFATHRRRKV